MYEFRWMMLDESHNTWSNCKHQKEINKNPIFYETYSNGHQQYVQEIWVQNTNENPSE